MKKWIRRADQRRRRRRFKKR